MKKKILLVLGICSLIFLLSGIYIITTIERSTAMLDNLIRLHRVEHIRDNLLIQLKRSQADLHLKNTRYARNMDTVVSHVRTMSSTVNGCFDCHHSERATRTLEELRDKTEQYKNTLSRVFTLRANQSRLEAEEDAAFKIGTDIVEDVNAITTITSQRLEERTQAVLDAIAPTKTFLYLLLVSVPLVALGLSVVYLRGFTKPVHSLLTATRRLKGGDLSFRIEGLRDEYGEVASSFNEMAASLQEHYRKMQWAEQVVVLGELAGGLAHEMKNPLAGIKGSLEVLGGDPLLSTDHKDILRNALEQIRRIEGLLQNLVNFARPPKPQLLRLNVNDVLDATIGLARQHPLFRSRDSRVITIVKEFDAGIPESMADPLQLQQVFMNLLLNAADAMADGGRLTIRSSHDPSSRKVQVAITDTGTGIDREVMGKIFLPFFTTKPKGTGLGLAITKRLVEQHGGSIQAENNAGGGAAFTILLPVHSETAGRAA